MRSPNSSRGIKTGLWLLGVLALYFAPLANSVAQQTRDVLAGQKLAVMPCRLGKAMPETPAAKKQIIDCTLSQLCYLEGEPLADAADIITDLLQQELQRRYGQNVLPQKAVRARFDSHPENSKETGFGCLCCFSDTSERRQIDLAGYFRPDPGAAFGKPL
ncbi:MAG: hypothetical protein P8130_11480 [Deltaproteobacteria bacterium]